MHRLKFLLPWLLGFLLLQLLPPRWVVWLGETLLCTTQTGLPFVTGVELESLRLGEVRIYGAPRCP